MKRFEYLPKLTEHLLFLALLIPTILLLALAALDVAELSQPLPAGLPEMLALRTHEREQVADARQFRLLGERR